MTINDFGFVLLGLSIGLSSALIGMRLANAFDKKHSRF